ncbi:MAG: vWA domain-containing protein [Verrucomicrobiota bacterium]
MSINLQKLNDNSRRRRQRKKLIISGIVISIVVHLLIGTGAAIWVVAKYNKPPEAAFEVRDVIKIPPKIIDPKVAKAEFEAAARKPVLDQKIASSRPSDISLPDIPTMPVDEIVKFDPSTVATTSTVGMAGQAGEGGDGEGAGGYVSSFFGLTTRGTHIAFVVDYSKSMRNRKEEVMRRELAKSVEELDPSVKFALIFFAGPVWLAGQDVNEDEWISNKNNDWQLERGKLRRPKWISATNSKKRQAVEHIQETELVYGTDWMPALEYALELDPRPDVIYFMTDGAEGGDQVSKTIGFVEKEFKEITLITIACGVPGAAGSLTRMAEAAGKGEFKLVSP